MPQDGCIAWYWAGIDDDTLRSGQIRTYPYSDPINFINILPISSKDVY